MAKKRISAARVLEELKAKGWSGGEITFMGESIGRYVTHGNDKGDTVFASRIYTPIRIETPPARKQNIMLGKVAKAMAAAMKEGTWPIPEEWQA